ncbi:MAG: glycerate kinase [Zestosphaera sp.]
MGFIRNISELSVSLLHEILLEVVEEGLARADPYDAVMRNLSVRDGRLTIGGYEVSIPERVHVVGFGKASMKMLGALQDLLGKVICGGVVITPDVEGWAGSVKILRGDHPFPTINTLKSSLHLLDYLEREVGENDLVLVLVSGGGSALFEVPEDELTLEEVSVVTKELMKRGADIVELNTVRKKLSRVKGGKLLKYVKAQKIVTLIMSDVVGDRLDVIASGPTVPDSTSFRDAYQILKKKNLWDDLLHKVRILIESGLANVVPDTLTVGDPLGNKVRNFIIASNQLVLEYLSSTLSRRGFNTILLTSMLEGEAREVGKVLGSIVRNIKRYSKPVSTPAAILAGGETVVTVRGSGVGGRNQELCLSFTASIRGLRDVVATCVGTDGIDGVSPAAGAVVDGELFEEATKRGLSPEEYLLNNDSYTFFQMMRRAIYTGYTGTNVNDIFVALIK